MDQGKRGEGSLMMGSCGGLLSKYLITDYVEGMVHLV